jgi:hypothetical protein
MLWRSNSDDEYDQPDDDFIDAPSPSRAVKSDEHNTDDNWNVSFRNTCSALQSLQATPQQVMEHLDEQSSGKASLERPTQSRVVLWTTSEDVVPVIVEHYRKREKEDKERQSWWITKVASHLYQSVVSTAKDEDYDVEQHWKDENDDYESEREVGWKDEIVNLDLAVQCCQELVKNAAVGSSARILFREGDSKDDKTVIGWIRTLSDEITVLSKLPEDQINVLIQVLLEMEQVHVVDDVLCLGAEEKDRNIQIALFRLDVAIQQTEESMDRWTQQRDTALAKAVQYKRLNKKVAALSELRRKALYDVHLERSQGTLLNLEQTRQAVETAQSQAQLTTVLQETASTWKEMRTGEEGLTVEKVDELALDLAEEYEYLEDVNGAVQKLSNDAADYDDDDLLKELENLTIAEGDDMKQSLDHADDENQSPSPNENDKQSEPSSATNEGNYPPSEQSDTKTDASTSANEEEQRSGDTANDERTEEEDSPPLASANDNKEDERTEQEDSLPLASANDKKAVPAT